MGSALKRFLWSVAFFAALCGAMVITHSDTWLTVYALSLVFIAVPVLILCWIDLGRSFRVPTASRAVFLLGVILGVPQALLGAICVVAGVSIVGWVLYNSFIERLPHYSGGFLTFGIGPLLVVFGLAWLRDAFSKQGVLCEISPNDAAADAGRGAEGTT